MDAEQTPTPLTDAFERDNFKDARHEFKFMFDFARDLERNLSEANEQIKQLKLALDVVVENYCHLDADGLKLINKLTQYRKVAEELANIILIKQGILPESYNNLKESDK